MGPWGVQVGSVPTGKAMHSQSQLSREVVRPSPNHVAKASG